MFRRTWPVLVAAAAMLGSALGPAAGAPRGAAPPAPAFEEPHGADLNQGKSPAEIFKSDCSVCHKAPQGLARDPASLTRFLRQHYTTGEPQAAALAGYLASVGGGARVPAVRATPERPDRPERPPASVGARRGPSAAEPAADDGLISPPGEKKRAPAEQASKPPEQASPAGRRRAQPEEANKPEPKPAPVHAGRPAKPEEVAKPAATEKPTPPEVMAPTRTAEPVAPPPPVEQKPAPAPPPPEIPL